MIAAVAVFSREYFSIIELMAFSYAISGCSFSTPEIQIDRNPRHKFPSRVNNPTPAMVCTSVSSPSTLSQPSLNALGSIPRSTDFA